MGVSSLFQIYKCNICGNIVEVLHVGGGELVCCGQPMVLQVENTVDAAREKHVPVVEKTSKGLLVKIGSVPHPMEEKHYIEWVELVADGSVYRTHLKPGDKPEAFFEIKPTSFFAREYCNLHGLWMAKSDQDQTILLDQGKVIKIEGDVAWVEFSQSPECARCKACHLGPSEKMVSEAENVIGAKVGDLVEVEISPVVVTFLPIIAFGIPIGLLFVGIILGSFISERAGIVFGALFLGIGFLVVRLVDRYVSKEKKFRSRIVRTL